MVEIQLANIHKKPVLMSHIVKSIACDTLIHVQYIPRWGNTGSYICIHQLWDGMMPRYHSNIRYGWQPCLLPTTCACGYSLTTEHALSFLMGGFPTICYNEIHAPTMYRVAPPTPSPIQRVNHC